MQCNYEVRYTVLVQQLNDFLEPFQLNIHFTVKLKVFYFNNCFIKRVKSRKPCTKIKFYVNGELVFLYHNKFVDHY